MGCLPPFSSGDSDFVAPSTVGSVDDQGFYVLIEGGEYGDHGPVGRSWRYDLQRNFMGFHGIPLSTC